MPEDREKIILAAQRRMNDQPYVSSGTSSQSVSAHLGGRNKQGGKKPFNYCNSMYASLDAEDYVRLKQKQLQDIYFANEVIYEEED